MPGQVARLKREPDEAATAEPLGRERREVLGAMAGLSSMARLWSRDDESAADLLQDTTERALRGLHRYRSGSNAAAWVRAIMYHLAVDRTRSSRREWRMQLQLRQLTTGLCSNQGLRLEHVDVASAGLGSSLTEVRAAAGRLREPVRATFLLWLDERLSYREIAARLRVPCNTVATRLLRARLQVRGFLRAGEGRDDEETASAI
jgi:RNA polymerase sigma-70 factor (ECF subfamily)